MISNHRLAERKLIAMIHDGYWRIDDQGHIWWSKIRRPSNAKVGTRAEKKLPLGYMMVRAMFLGTRVNGLSHRLIWQNCHGNIPEGKTINHINGIKDDNRLANLEVASYSQQQKHAYATNLRDEHGEANPACVLSDIAVEDIRKKYQGGMITLAELGDEYGCSFQTLSQIVRGTRRTRQAGPTISTDNRHIPEEYRDPKTGRITSKKHRERVPWR